MRPVKLRMKGFVSYVDDTVIDFSKFGSDGVFVIGGETGAGKTTIFDAITFALYGEASGAEKGALTLRSEYLKDKSDRTEVEFTFEHLGKTYTAYRELKGTQNRTTGVISSAKGDVNLYEGSSLIASGIDNVNNYIKGILQIDSNQFRQMFMLPQGQFRSVLTAGETVREDILRKIFMTEKYERLCSVLGERSKQSERDYKAIGTELRSAFAGVITPGAGELSDEYERVKADDEVGSKQSMDRWLGVLGRIISEGTAEADTKEKQRSEADALYKQLLTEYSNAERDNQDFDQLDKLKQEREIIEKDRPFVEKDAKHYERGHAACYTVRPIAVNCKNLADRHNRNLGQLRQITEELGQLQQQLSGVDIEKLKRERDELLSAAQRRNSECDAFERATLHQIDGLRAEEDKLNGLKGKLSSVNTQYNAASKSYDDASDYYYGNIAGIIARNLKQGEACPVCGSTEHPRPAVAAHSDIYGEMDEKKLEELKRQRDNIDSARQQLMAEVSTLEGKHSTNMSTVIKLVTDRGVTVAGDDIYGAVPVIEQKISSTREGVASDNRRASELGTQIRQLEELSAKAAGMKGKQDNLDKMVKDDKAAFEAERAKYIEAIRTCGFTDEEEYKTALMDENSLRELADKLNRFRTADSGNRSSMELFEGKLRGKSRVSLAPLQVKRDEAADRTRALTQEVTRLNLNNETNSRIYEKLKSQSVRASALYDEYILMSNLDGIFSGNLGGVGKVKFETYVQLSGFNSIIGAANRRLMKLSKGRFELIRHVDPNSRSYNNNLNLDVKDRNTGGKARPVATLSGGEGFMATLSLALGLADNISARSGGVQVDALFIDEGFGTLDSGTIDKVVEVLKTLALDNKLIGLISHIDELNDAFGNKIMVEMTPTGSKLNIQTGAE